GGVVVSDVWRADVLGAGDLSGSAAQCRSAGIRAATGLGASSERSERRRGDAASGRSGRSGLRTRPLSAVRRWRAASVAVDLGARRHDDTGAVALASLA